MEYISQRDEEKRFFFLTPLATKTKKNILVITCIVHQNWEDVVNEMDSIIMYLHKHHNFTPSDYSYVLHAYFETISIEQFYQITNNEKKLAKISIGQLDRLLS